MASSNLLKEAIADAKAVRETAIANAKLALEEAFTPKLQSMLSNKIEEELDENDELEEQSDTSGIGAGDNKVNMASGDDEEKNAETEKETAAYGSEDPNLKVVDKLTEADEDEDEKDEMMKEEDEDDNVEINIDADGDDNDEDDMDMELEAIIKELEEDEDEQDEMKEMEDEKSEEDEADEMMKEADEDEKSEMEDEKDEMMKEEDENLEEDLNIESILAALKEEDETEEEEEKDEMYKEQLEEAYNTIKSLKSTLNEVNLLNAKLLFSNKLFKSQNLTESQKMRVIETFDRAHSLREVKLVYTTLAESMKSAVSKTKKLRTEGLASKAQTTTKPKQVIAEGNDMASRMRKLAGLL